MVEINLHTAVPGTDGIIIQKLLNYFIFHRKTTIFSFFTDIDIVR